MKRILLIPVLLLVMYTVSAQRSIREWPLDVGIFNNGNFMPGTGFLGIWSKAVHPGVSLGTRYPYFDKTKHLLFQTARLGYFYHRHAQHGIQLYSELGYRYKFSPSFFAEARIGAGYLLSVVALQQFEWNNGVYEEKGWKGRSQFMGGTGIYPGYSLYPGTGIPVDIYIGYQFWVQAPFVNKYVPVLPHNSVYIGIIHYFNLSKNDQ